MDKKKKTKQATRLAVPVAAAAILLLLAVLWLLSGKTQAHGNALARTDLPGFAAVTLEEAERGILRAENHSAQQAPVTLVDETGRAWKLSAPGWNFLWIYTDAVGALVEAHNIHSDETIVFHLGHPDDALEAFPIQIQEELVADPLFTARQFLLWSWNEPDCNKPQFQKFVEDVLQIEEIRPEEVGQTIAFGEHLNAEQCAEFTPRLLLNGGSSRAVQTTLLSEMPLTANKAAFEKEYTNKHGLSFNLRWNDTLDEDLLFATFTVYAAFGENEAIQLVLDQNYLTENELTSTEAALLHVEQALDHFSSFAG